MVGVCVRKYYLYTTTAYTSSCAWSLHVVVVPATHHLDGKLIHVVVVVKSWRITIEWAISLFMIRIALLVPILAQAFIATVFHCPHGMFLALIDVQHLTSIFGLVDIQHFATADSTSAVRIVFVAYLFHLHHMFTRDTLVATLIEED